MTTIETFQNDLCLAIQSAVQSLGCENFDGHSISFSPVPDNAKGDIAMACFPLRGRLLKLDDKTRNNPAAIAQNLALALSDCPFFEDVSAVGPYVNISYNTASLSQIVLGEILTQNLHFADAPKKNARVVIEFSAPNTNKPQHLGHLRNNVIGDAMSRLLAKSGYDVKKVNIINDRGIHICKSMLMYMKHHTDLTPEKAGKKGDHLVGDFYVEFDKEFQAEYKTWLQSEDGKAAFNAFCQSEAGKKARAAIDAYEAAPENKRKGKAPGDIFSVFKAATKDSYFNTQSKLGKEATELLIKWENGDKTTREIWKRLNSWVIDGFMDTYKTLGITFDKIYFESDTYKLGKDLILEGLKNGIFHRLQDNAVAFDLTKIGLSGEKIVLRSNGTSVYITQDIGTAVERYKDFHYDRMIYVTGDEQIHHFKVLFGIMSQLRPELKNALEHLAYGMVTLPNGRMKSREGTVVDTDDLILEMSTLVRGLMDNKSDKEHYLQADRDELSHRAQTIALAALKYFLLDVPPTSWMEFNPEKSVDLQGRTGAYCLMNYARTRSILRKAGYQPTQSPNLDILSCLRSTQEKKILLSLMQLPNAIRWATESKDPSKLAEYLFNLCKTFAFIFTDKAGHPILTCPDENLKAARLALVHAISIVLKIGLNLLAIETLEEM